MIITVYVSQYSFVGMDIIMGQIGRMREDCNERLSFLVWLVTQCQNNEVNNQGIEEKGRRKIPV